MKKTARAYGKINLALAITGRRQNGYHDLLTVMQSVSLYNTVEVSENKKGGISLSSDDSALPTDERNTAYRAGALFLELAGLSDSTGLDIYIKKRVPYQAGMGSASADAAGVLAAANSLFGDALPHDALLEAAGRIGADVPFCLEGGCCLAEGIGDRLTKLSPCPDCTLLILHPKKGISTPEAYRRFDELVSPVQPDVEACVSALEKGSLKAVAESCGNMFELCCDIADVFEIKRRLIEQGALAACMTGSGTAVFGIFAEQAKAEAAQKALCRFGWDSWLAEPVSSGVIIE